MKILTYINIVLVLFLILGCDNNQPQTISASATATRNSEGKIVVRDATRSEEESIHTFHNRIMKINKQFPAPAIPFSQQTFEVRSITDDGIFILENDTIVKMSGIKCSPGGVHFIRKFFKEETERLAYKKEKISNDNVIESYIWEVDSSIMNDPEMKDIATGPSFSGINDTAILNNWCEIDPTSSSIYLQRYAELEKISKKKKR